MKKISFILIFATIVLTAQPALANSAPIHYDSEGPHYSMGVLADCEIGVEREDLSFNIHYEDDKLSFMDVSASYEMKNYGAAQSVTMAFPILFRLDDIDTLTSAKVNLDGQAIEVEPIFVSSLRHLAVLNSKNGGRWFSGDSEIEQYAKDLQIESLLSYCNSPDVRQPGKYDSYLTKKLRDRYPSVTTVYGEEELLVLVSSAMDFYKYDYFKDALSKLSEEKMAGLLLYEIPFEAGQSRRVEVVYKQRPDYFASKGDMRADYSYITGPARHYRDFGTLDIWVRFIDRPPRFSGWVHSETVEFEKIEDDVFFASMEGLPQDQLAFSVSCVEHKVPWGLYYIFLILSLPIIAIVSVIIVYIITKRNMKRMRAERQRRGN